eukprot:363682-Chlamydomonas_euryale.AAC.15
MAHCAGGEDGYVARTAAWHAHRATPPANASSYPRVRAVSDEREGLILPWLATPGCVASCIAAGNRLW